MTCSSSWCSRRVKFARSLPSLLMGEGQGEGEKVPTIALTQCNLVIRQLRGVLGFGHLGFERPGGPGQRCQHHQRVHYLPDDTIVGKVRVDENRHAEDNRLRRAD